MDDFQLLIDLYKNTHRQGPGGEAELEKALDLARLDRAAPLEIADIGCGTGAATLLLAQRLHAHITAVDMVQDFLDVLAARAAERGLADRLTTLCRSMDDLPFREAQYDVIWSEGAVYNIGFERGVRDWRPYLKAGGILVVSEITWITAERPSEIEQYWQGEYPEIDLASAKMGVLEQHGYAPIGYFVLPEYCWLDHYYRPLQNSFADFLNRHGNRKEARRIVEAEKNEIALYEKYKGYYSYGVYIARKSDTR